MKRFAVVFAALSLALATGACNNVGAGTDGNAITDGGGNGTDGGQPGNDGGQTDGGSPTCGGAVGPNYGSCCTSCQSDVNGCQPNGCYGGWFCDPTSCACVPAPAGCGGTTGTDGGTPGNDGGTPDAGVTDAGTPDAGTPDAGVVDAGTPDAGTPDAGVTDAGTPDAGGSDGGTTNTCPGYAMPGTSSCCHSCTPGGSNCQANGCYGGWVCNTSTCYCKSPTICPSGGTDGGTTGNDGGTTGNDGGTTGNDGGTTGSDGGAPGCTTGTTTWPATTGPLACSTPGCYLYSQYSGRCGVWCWSYKTGTDSGAGTIDMNNIVTTTIAAMDAMTGPSYLLTCSNNNNYCNCWYDTNNSGNRYPPQMTTVYELKNVHLSDIGLEADSDYHMDLDDGNGHTMVAEIPSPRCVGSSSPLGCNISHARAAVDAVAPPNAADVSVNYTVTVIGVGFFDFAHNPPVTGSAPNAMELHPVLRMCFGQNCDPMASP